MGTLTVAPVSSTAGFSARPCAVLPLAPGAASTTLSVTVFGTWTSMAFPRHLSTLSDISSLIKSDLSMSSVLIRSSSNDSMFMKTCSSPSMYENVISSLSTCASGNDSPAFHVFSSTLPVCRFFSLERTNAEPLPGFTCRNSTTFHTLSSNSIVRPILKSLVLPIMGCAARETTRDARSGEEASKACAEHAKRSAAQRKTILP
mmetsp:Transcript_48448/g.127536  ORF Transcript_48448/g.127536 Transcript_48448/m.127536 type:complete len:203 (+) Transcript_48448:375-983(+)